jgi:hypothetical protein
MADMWAVLPMTGQWPAGDSSVHVESRPHGASGVPQHAAVDAVGIAFEDRGVQVGVGLRVFGGCEEGL